MARRNLRRRASRLLAPLAVLFLAAGPATAAAQLSSREVADRGPRAWAITGGMVHVGDGTVLEEATVVIRDGLIVSVAAGGEVPAGAAGMDAAGKHVYPGFITALSDLGLGGDSAAGPARGPRAAGAGAPSPPPPSRGPEDRPDTFSWRLAADDLRASDERIAARRSTGFTSAVSAPPDGIVSGRAALLNLAGPEGVDARDLVVAPDVAVMVRLGTRGFRSFPVP